MDELNEILERCLSVCGTTLADVQSKPRMRRTVEAKQLFVYCALHMGRKHYKKKLIAGAIGVGPWQVTYYRKKAEFGIKCEPWFKALVKKYLA